MSDPSNVSRHTISSALRAIKGLAGKLAEVDRRIQSYSVHQKEEEPALPWKGEVEKRALLVKEMVALRSAVSVANATTMLDNGMILAEALHTLAQLKATIHLYSSIPTRVKKEEVVKRSGLDYDDNGKPYRHSIEETFISEMTEAEKIGLIDGLREEFSKINRQVEFANHANHLK